MVLQPDNMKSLSNFVYVAALPPVKCRYWFKFYVNTMTVSGVTTIFVYKGLTRNLEIRNTPV